MTALVAQSQIQSFTDENTVGSHRIELIVERSLPVVDVGMSDAERLAGSFFITIAHTNTR